MKSKILFIVVLFSLVSFSGCVTHAPKESEWPKEIPPRQYFVEHFEADIENKKNQDLDEYLLWVSRFYNGWELYSNGWIKVTKESLVGVKDPAVATEIKTKMGLIGQGISGEWAKNKNDRRILLRHVVVWGNALVESIRRDEELKLINRVLNDVNGVLENRVAIEDIKAERYYSKDKDDVFN